MFSLRTVRHKNAQFAYVSEILTAQFHDRIDITINPNKGQKKKEKIRRKNRIVSAKPSYRLVDRARWRVQGGAGGKGSVSSEIVASRKLRPDGGHGGEGGSVIIVADAKMPSSLASKKSHFMAEKGGPGGSQVCAGRNGNNLIIRVPCGVLVKQVIDTRRDAERASQMYSESSAMPYNEQAVVQENKDSSDDSDDDDNDDISSGIDYEAIARSGGKFIIDVEPDGEDDDSDHDSEYDSDFESYSGGDKTSAKSGGGDDYKYYEYDDEPSKETRKVNLLADLDQPGSHIVVARGGRGGIGSCVYASRNGPMPDALTVLSKAKPTDGEVAYIELELKLIADIGLVGFPNAGKSSLLCATSRATPAVAPYPFTTLHPLVGNVEYRDGMKVKVADIPGLISGASQGRGKGFDFLRHIERTKALCYMVDAAGVDGRDPLEDLRVLAQELESYGDGTLLTDRRALVVANKIDLLEHQDEINEMLYQMRNVARDVGISTYGDIHGISAGATGIGLAQLTKMMRQIVTDDEVYRQHPDAYHNVY